MLIALEGGEGGLQGKYYLAGTTPDNVGPRPLNRARTPSNRYTSLPVSVVCTHFLQGGGLPYYCACVDEMAPDANSRGGDGADVFCSL